MTLMCSALTPVQYSKSTRKQTHTHIVFNFVHWNQLLQVSTSLYRTSQCDKVISHRVTYRSSFLTRTSNPFCCYRRITVLGLGTHVHRTCELLDTTVW